MIPTSGAGTASSRELYTRRRREGQPVARGCPRATRSCGCRLGRRSLLVRRRPPGEREVDQAVEKLLGAARLAPDEDDVLVVARHDAVEHRLGVAVDDRKRRAHLVSEDLGKAIRSRSDSPSASTAARRSVAARSRPISWPSRSAITSSSATSSGSKARGSQWWRQRVPNRLPSGSLTSRVQKARTSHSTPIPSLSRSQEAHSAGTSRVSGTVAGDSPACTREQRLHSHGIAAPASSSTVGCARARGRRSARPRSPPKRR